MAGFAYQLMDEAVETDYTIEAMLLTGFTKEVLTRDLGNLNRPIRLTMHDLEWWINGDGTLLGYPMWRLWGVLVLLKAGYTEEARNIAGWWGRLQNPDGSFTNPHMGWMSDEEYESTYGYPRWTIFSCTGLTIKFLVET